MPWASEWQPAASIMLLYFVVCLVMSCQVALEYLLKGPTTSGEQVKAEVKSKLSDEHIKVGDYALTLFCFPFPTGWLVGLFVFFLIKASGGFLLAGFA